MTTFAQALEARHAPGKTLLLEPWVFADTWDEKPDSAVCVGLRLLPDGDKSVARHNAEKLADEYHKEHPGEGNWVDSFNDALIRQVVALCLCDPNDVRKPTELLPLAEETVRYAFTSRGAAYVFDQLNRYEIEVSSIESELDEEHLAEFCEQLKKNFGKLYPANRRLLASVFQAIRD